MSVPLGVSSTVTWVLRAEGGRLSAWVSGESQTGRSEDTTTTREGEVDRDRT